MAARIVARDTVPYVGWIGLLPDGDLLAIEEPGFAVPPGRLVRRDGTTFEAKAWLEGVNEPGALSPSGRWLLAGGLYEGSPGAIALIDVPRWEVVERLPLQRPFAWIDDDRFVAQTPRFATRLVAGRLEVTRDREVDPAIAARAPHLLAHPPGLVLVDRRTLAARPLLPAALHDDEKAIAISADGAVAWVASGYSRISAVRLADSALRWQRPANRLSTDGTIHALAVLSPGVLMTVGSGEVDLAILDATTGAPIATYDIGARSREAGLPAVDHLTSIAVRADGHAVIGANKGVLVEHLADGRIIAHKPAGREIQAVAFLADGGIVLGGAEAHLRVLPASDGRSRQADPPCRPR